jgi:uncharacterized protein (DUF58 family)
MAKSPEPIVSEAAQILPPDMMGKLERMELVSRKIFRGRMKGERRSKRKGQSVEFADFRNYSLGDDLRFIDWNLFARLDRLYLKLFLEEEDLHFFAIIDDSLSMDFGSPSKLFAAKQIAASLGYIGLCRGDRVSLSGFSTIDRPAILRGKSSVYRMLSYLQGIEASKTGPTMQDAIKHYCTRTRSKGIVVLITDLMCKEGYENALRLLVTREMDIFLVHLLSPEEWDPNLQGDLKLIDVEDGDAQEISVSAHLIEKYQENLERFIEGAKSFCNKRSIMYVPARSDQGADLLIGDYLRTRGLVR